MRAIVQAASCELFASWDMHCPLCRRLVPANTPHRCTQLPAAAAREKFAIGDRVELVNWTARRNAARTGVVTAFGRKDRAIVYVRRDSAKAAEAWHMDRWQLIPSEGR